MPLQEFTQHNSYVTPPGVSTFFSRVFPSLSHYLRIAGIIFSAGSLAGRGEYTAQDWIKSSADTLHSLEKTGTKIHIEGLEHFKELGGPCVFIGNHMSTLETFALPCIIEPFKKVTFVTKDSLLKYPYFGKVLASRNPIVVGRVNPREDLTTMLKEGQKRIEDGVSIIVFPQSTRSFCFDLTAFNSIGIKLARRAGVPIVPVAVKTDVWGVGRFIKDFGPVMPQKDVRLRFGSSLMVQGNGKEEHAQVCDFISSTLKQWGVETIKSIAPSTTAALTSGQ